MAKAKKKAVKKFVAPGGHDPHRVMQNGVAKTLGMRIVSMSKKKIVATAAATAAR